MLLRIWGKDSRPDTDDGEDEWFGEGLVHMALWLSGPESRFGLGLGAGAGLGNRVCKRMSRVGAPHW